MAILASINFGRPDVNMSIKLDIIIWNDNMESEVLTNCLADLIQSVLAIMFSDLSLHFRLLFTLYSCIVLIEHLSLLLYRISTSAIRCVIRRKPKIPS